MKKSELKPWLKKCTWIVRPIALLTIILSPIVLAYFIVIIVWDERGELIEAYNVVIDVLLNGVEE